MTLYSQKKNKQTHNKIELIEYVVKVCDSDYGQPLCCECTW